MKKTIVFLISIIVTLSLIVCSLTIQAEGQRGNSLGNILVNGSAGKSRDYIFYKALLKRDDIMEVVLCKENLKNGKKEKIYEGEFRSLNVYGGWVYFCAITDNYKESPLYRVRIDGKKLEKISDAVCEFTCIVDDYIYYVDRGDQNKLYRINLDGSNKHLICDENCWAINVVDDAIYCMANDTIKKLTLDGKKRTKIIKGNFSHMIYHDDWIYYTMKYDSKIFKVRADGTGKKAITADTTNFFTIYNNEIYYASDNLYRIDLNGNNKRKIGKVGVGSIIEDWIYTYEPYEEWVRPVRISIDGKKKEVLYLK